jgi:hypothetical protein
MRLYQSAVYCDACGRQIEEDLGRRDDNDSEAYPQYFGDDGESDSPQHCANGADCRDALRLAAYGLRKRDPLYGAETRAVGTLFGTLTEDGVRYVRDLMRQKSRTPYQRALHRSWREFYQV